MKKVLFSIFICVFLAQLSHAEMKLTPDCTLVFATVEEGRKILTTRDDFVQRMSPFDRAARLKTDAEVSQKEYLEFVGKNVLTWNDAEKEMVTTTVKSFNVRFDSLHVPLPKKIVMIKTTGEEEGRAAYTRANAIVLPQSFLRTPNPKIHRTLRHELFHVMSRANPKVREKFYAAIGFVKCSEVELPAEMKNRKITNPDAPRNDHCIRVRVAGEEHWVVPVLFSRTEKYDVNRGGSFLRYLVFRFLLVERDEKTSKVEPIYEDGKPRLVALQEVSGFFEQVGKNTDYVIHPEEILAENFADLIMLPRDLPSPEIIDKMRIILVEEKKEREKKRVEVGAEPNPILPRMRRIEAPRNVIVPDETESSGR